MDYISSMPHWTEIDFWVDLFWSFSQSKGVKFHFASVCLERDIKPTILREVNESSSSFTHMGESTTKPFHIHFLNFGSITKCKLPSCTLPSLYFIFDKMSNCTKIDQWHATKSMRKQMSRHNQLWHGKHVNEEGKVNVIIHLLFRKEYKEGLSFFVA